MGDAIEAGSILIQTAGVMLDSWMPQGQPVSDGWISLDKLDRSALESGIHKAGGTFFFQAGEIRATVFGFDRQETVRKAVKRLGLDVKARRLNCLEITRVATSSFLGVPYVTVAAHARHIQKGLALHRTTTRPDGAGSQPPIRSSLGQRGDVTGEPLLAEEAVGAWEDEGGAPGHIGGRRAA